MFPMIIRLSQNNNRFSPIRNKTQKNIINLLCKNKGLSVKQISRQLNRKYSTIYEELQNMKQYRQITKNRNKKYFTNPKYGDYLINSGLKIVGADNKNSVFILKERVKSIKEKTTHMERVIRLLEKTIKKLINVGS